MVKFDDAERRRKKEFSDKLEPIWDIFENGFLKDAYVHVGFDC